MTSSTAPRQTWRRWTVSISGWRGRVAFTFATFVLAVALFGPLVSPHSPTAILGIPATGPSGRFPLGTDFLGRDVLSRLLWGGRSVVVLAGIATAAAYLVGVPIGLISGYSRSWVDGALMRAMDVLLAFPPILFLLVLATGTGPSAVGVVIGIGVIHVPGIARIVRAATLETSVRGYVEAAVARGESLRHILFREILPNIRATILADAGPRLTVSILLVAALNFLGLGLRPPSANWALMISENRAILTLQPWALLAPAILIAVLTVSLNIVADELAGTAGRSSDEDVMRR